MERKDFRFLFLFLPILLASLVISEIDVNPQLQTNVNCTGLPEDSCDPDSAFCNSAGKCQCRFGYTPSTSGLSCERLWCSTNAQCSQLYHDEHAECRSNLCFCHFHFRLDPQTQKCAFKSPTTRRLGARCVADHQCGIFAKCTNSGQCQCMIGARPDTAFTCNLQQCSSDEFCHTNVTANTVCSTEFKFCVCKEPNIEHDDEKFTCLATRPPALKLGANCSNSTRCGEGAKCTTGNPRICKCRVGYEATTDTRCEPVRCAKDKHCHKNVSPLTSCYNGKEKRHSSCGCKKGYFENPENLTCTPNPSSSLLRDRTPRRQ